jgi:hypothetical protein
MNEAGLGQPIDHRTGLFVSLLRRRLIFCVDRFQDILDLGTHERTAGGVVRTVFLRLAGALLCLCCIGQSLISGTLEAAQYADSAGFCQSRKPARGAAAVHMPYHRLAC